MPGGSQRAGAASNRCRGDGAGPLAGIAAHLRLRPVSPPHPHLLARRTQPAYALRDLPRPRDRREAQPQVRGRRLGAEVRAAGGDRDARAQGRPGQRRLVGAVRQPQPQVVAARTGRSGRRRESWPAAARSPQRGESWQSRSGPRQAFRLVSSPAISRRWRGQAGEPTSSRAASWSGPRHEEGVDDLDGAQPLQHRAAGGQRAHPEARRGRLGQRADMDDDAVGVVGGQRAAAAAPASSCTSRRTKSSSIDERAGLAGDPQHLARAARGRAPRRSGSGTAAGRRTAGRRWPGRRRRAAPAAPRPRPPGRAPGRSPAARAMASMPG